VWPFNAGPLGKCLHEPAKRDFKRLGVEHAEDTAERVVARKAMLQNQHVLPKIGLHPRKQGHIHATGRPAQRRHQGDEQQLRQIVQCVVRTRVRQVFKALRKLLHWPLHHNPELPSESISSRLATT
jgi:hypothetical protein